MTGYSVLVGDCRDNLRAAAAAGFKARMCVTSPPYFGLRDYGHDGQLGLEETPEQYVAAMVEVFRAVRDVLTDDGTLWVNIGDSYARNPAKGQHGPGQSGKQEYIYGIGNGRATAYAPQVERRTAGTGVGQRGAQITQRAAGDGIKEKDLIGIPWMLAFALRADGWYLRQEIIWHKPNPMPESVRDRCTKAHEQIFLLSKSPRYFYDHEAVKEPAIGGTPGNSKPIKNDGTEQMRTRDGLHLMGASETRNKRSVWTVANRPYAGAHFAVYPPELIEPCILAGSAPGDLVIDPFGGSGTTAGVAVKHGRHALMFELNPEYAALMPERVAHIIKQGTK